MIKRFTSLDEVSNITNEDIFKPQITMIGIGGAGINAVNNMINMGLSGIKFVVINTDMQSLKNSIAPMKIQIGPKVTKGLGAGSRPEMGGQAAEESLEDIKLALEGTNMLIIAAGMGGGTGTGASQVIAKLAKDMGILTMAFVTKPFKSEGAKRKEIATKGVEALEEYVDSIIIISNDNLLIKTSDKKDKKLSVAEAFKMVDSVLFFGIKSITDVITANGIINLDFNDIKSVIEGMGKTMIGSAEAEGDDRCEAVINQALTNDLLDNTSLIGAKKALINITGSEGDLGIQEVNTIAMSIQEKLEAGAFMHVGIVYDSSMENNIRVSIIATGLTENPVNSKEKPKVVVPVYKPIEEPSKSSKFNLNLHKPASIGMYNDDIEPDNTESYGNDEIESDFVVNKSLYEEDVRYDSNFFNDNDIEESSHEENYLTKEVNEQKDKPTEKLFDLITKSREERARKKEDIKEKAILNIKNRTIIAKLGAKPDSSKEDSFFDLPSFLKIKKDKTQDDY